ncbi:MAG: hypothetical protein ACYDC2_03845 [Solirubrobacteraceae bacterium]
MRAPRRALGAAAAAVLTLALSACETTQEKSARLEKVALAHGVTSGKAAKGLTIARPSTILKVLSTGIVHSTEGTAVAVTVRNTSAKAQQQVPLAITVRDGRGGSLYSNAAPGIAPSLTSIGYVPAHGQAQWVDDQVQAAGTPASVTAEVGEGQPASGPPPQLRLSHQTPVTEAGGSQIHGHVTNASPVEQRELVVDALATRGGKLLAAGRAVLAHLGPGMTSNFEVLLIGAPPAGATVRIDLQPARLR